MKRKNDAPWRNAVFALRGPWCRSCGTNRDLQCDHIKPKSQGGPSVVPNGLPMCRDCHEKKTNSQLKFRHEWLDDDTIAWLAEVGWVAWDDAGQPYGRGWRHFEARKVLA